MRAVVVFTVAYTVILFVYGSAVESPLSNLYTGINVGLFLLFGILNTWAGWTVSSLWAASLVGLGNMLGGVLLVDGQPLYMAELIGALRYDNVFHFLASGALVLIAWEAMKRWSEGVHHVGGQLLLTWLVVMGGGAVVEIAELIGSTMSGVSVGDYANNALDLVANAIGAGVGVVIVWSLERRRDIRPEVSHARPATSRPPGST